MPIMGQNNLFKKIIIPLFIAIFIQIIFLSLLRINWAKNQQHKQFSVENKLVTLPMQNVSNRYITEMQNRLKLDNPALFSLPDEKYGYSKIRVNDWTPPDPVIEKYDVKILPMKKKEQKNLTLVEPRKPLSISAPEDWLEKEMTITPESISFPTQWINWKKNNQFSLPPFSKEETFFYLKKYKKNDFLQETFIEVHFNGGLFSPTLKQSSGVNELDSFALRSLTKKFHKKILSEKQKKESLVKTLIFTVDWRSSNIYK